MGYYIAMCKNECLLGNDNITFNGAKLKDAKTKLSDPAVFNAKTN
jgi:hypothetical protein